MGKLVIFSAPSGSGKTTIVRELLSRFPQFEFSVSATSRAPRGAERDGIDYFFLSPEAFRQAVREDRFVEWEEVYEGTCYGTLRSEVERIWGQRQRDRVRRRCDRGTEPQAHLRERRLRDFRHAPFDRGAAPTAREPGHRRSGGDRPAVAKAEFELTKASEFDRVVINDDLGTAVEEVSGILRQFLNDALK